MFLNFSKITIYDSLRQYTCLQQLTEVVLLKTRTMGKLFLMLDDPFSVPLLTIGAILMFVYIGVQHWINLFRIKSNKILWMREIIGIIAFILFFFEAETLLVKSVFLGGIIVTLTYKIFQKRIDKSYKGPPLN